MLYAISLPPFEKKSFDLADLRMVPPLLIIFFTSCNTNYNNALKYLETATELNSQDYLDDAKFEYNLIDES